MLTADFISLLGNAQFLISILIIFFLFSKDFEKFVDVFYILGFTVIYNTIVKEIVKMPLPETCHSLGYGFPSGHMNFYAAPLIYFALHSRKIFKKVLLLAVIPIVGFSIVYSGFHYPEDVIAGVCFAGLWNYLYLKFIQNKEPFNKFIFIALLSISVIISLFYIKGFLPDHVNLAFYSLCGIFFSFTCLFSKGNKDYKRLIIVGIFLILFQIIMKYLSNGGIIDLLCDMRWIIYSSSIVCFRKIFSLAKIVKYK